MFVNYCTTNDHRYVRIPRQAMLKNYECMLNIHVYVSWRVLLIYQTDIVQWKLKYVYHFSLGKV